MAYTSYITIDGMLIGEITPAGEMRNYGTDALGSVVTTSLNGVAENTYRYKPYGGLLAKTGTAADPPFLWNGGSGYRATTLPNTTHYVRRRHYTEVAARWTTSDPLWPGERAYPYCRSVPSLCSDPTGTAPVGISPPSAPCCIPLGVSWTTVSTIIGADFSPSDSCYNNRSFPDFYGLYGYWTVESTIGKPEAGYGTPCLLVWRECNSTLAAPGTTVNCQQYYLYQEGVNEQCDAKSCSTGFGSATCVIYDVPGTTNVKTLNWSNGSRYNWNVCIKWTLSGACTDQIFAITQYLKFTLTVTNNNGTLTASPPPSMVLSDENCSVSGEWP